MTPCNKAGGDQIAALIGAFRSVSGRRVRTVLISLVLALCVAILISTMTGVQTSKEGTQQLADKVAASTTELVANTEASTNSMIANVQSRIDELAAEIQAAADEMVAAVTEGAATTTGIAESLETLITVGSMQFAPSGGGPGGGPGGGFVVGGGGSAVDVTITEEDVADIAAIDGVKLVIPQYTETVGQTEDSPRDYDYQAYGVVLDSSLVNQYSTLPATIIEGRQLQEGDENAVIISLDLMDYFLNPKVGDKLSLEGARGLYTEFEVVGIYYSTNPGEQKIVYMSLDAAQELYEAGDEVTSVQVYVEDKDTIEDVAAGIEALNDGWMVRTPNQNQFGGFGEAIAITQEQQVAQIQRQAEQQITSMQESATTQIQSMQDSAELQTTQMQEDAANQVASLEEDLARIQNLSLLIILVAGIAGVLMIFGIMFYTVRERTREIGTFKALGFSSFEVMKRFILEGLFIGIFGGVLGLALGAASYTLLAHWLLGINESIPLSLGSSYMLLGLGAAILFGALGSIYPAWQASRVSPMEALRNR